MAALHFPHDPSAHTFAHVKQLCQRCFVPASKHYFFFFYRLVATEKLLVSQLKVITITIISLYGGALPITFVNCWLAVKLTLRVAGSSRDSLMTRELSECICWQLPLIPNASFSARYRRQPWIIITPKSLRTFNWIFCFDCNLRLKRGDSHNFSISPASLNGFR